LFEETGYKHRCSCWTKTAKLFCEKNRRYIGDLSVREVCLVIAEFLMPVVQAIAQDKLLQKHWNPAGPWK
jgi:hypothetical protein